MLKLKLELYQAIISVLTLIPLVAAAQTVGRALYNACIFASQIVVLLIVIAFLIFIWGIVQFILSAGDETKQAKAKAILTWGVVGLAVLFGIQMIIAALIGSFAGGGLLSIGVFSQLFTPSTICGSVPVGL